MTMSKQSNQVQQFQGELIRYRNGAGLAFLLRFPDGRYIEIPIFGIAQKEIELYYSLEITESYETYEHVSAHAKKMGSNMEEEVKHGQ